MSDYQLFDPLPPEQYEALKADIARRGVMVPIELDEDGNILDGHHRSRICAVLGIECPTIVRADLDEDGKREHVLKLNLLRRHLGPLAWADAFRQLAEMRGVQVGQGKRNDRTSAKLAEVAAEVGVSERTARRRLRDVKKLTEHRDLIGAVDSGDMEVKRALRVVRERDAQEHHRQRAAEIAERARQRERDGIERVYDLWTSPCRWLLKEADRVARKPPTEEEMANRLKYFRWELPSTSGLTHTTSNGTVQQIPEQVAADPGSMAAVDETHALVAGLRNEAEERFAQLHDWIAEQAQVTAEALREAARHASDEPSILIGRSYQLVTADEETIREHDHGGTFIQQDVRNMGVQRWKTLHEPDGCICENAVPLGCVDIRVGRPCCAAVEVERGHRNGGGSDE